MEAHSFARSDGGLTLPRSRKLLAAFGDERLVAQVRRGNDAAFEVLYDRHHAAVLSYCRHMLGSRDEAEDALQQAFVSAHGDIVSTDKEIRFKAWIYTIARNRCLSVLRARREQPSDDLERVSTVGLSEEVAHRAELKEIVADIQELPDDQRTALLLSELGDLSHAEVAEVIDCEVAKVKSLVFQARAGLIERRQARETPCQEIREQLAVLSGGSLRRGPLRRHLKACPGCSEFRAEVKRQRQMVAAVLPVIPTLALKENALAAVGISAASAGSGAFGGAGAVFVAKTGVAKVAVIAAATTGSVGGAVAIEQSVDGDSPRSGSQLAPGASDAGAAGTSSSTAEGVRRENGGLAPAGETTSDGKRGAGAEDKRGTKSTKGGSNGEQAREFARRRAKGRWQVVERERVARGGMNPNAGKKPRQEHAAAKPEHSGPQNDKPKPEPGLGTLLPSMPELVAPDKERVDDDPTQNAPKQPDAPEQPDSAQELETQP